jgi:hypothetical protein
LVGWADSKCHSYNSKGIEEGFLTYKKNGWLREMEDQLRSVNADVNAFRSTEPEDFVAIRFSPKSLELLEIPMEFSRDDPAVVATYYTLMNQKLTPTLIGTNKKFEFAPGHNEKKNSTKSTYDGHSSDIDLVHNKIQTKIFHQLRKKFGKDNVGTERPTGFGSKVDVVVKESDGGFIFYEIKTSCFVRLCIREALSQLLEYTYYPNNNNAKKLVIVSPSAITPESISYLKSLRDRFDIPIYYQAYDLEKEALEDTLY